MQTALGEATTKEMKKLLAEQLDKNLDAEMQVVELTWKLDGLTYKTQCVVSDAGIVYDNLIANMACYQKREVSVK